ncbi:MAG: NAD(P)H-dependent oxidoreductase, partial [Brachybacterium sp.]
MTKLGIIVASARPNRVGDHVARWVRDAAPAGVVVDLIDLREVALPAFDGTSSPKAGLPKETDHSRSWGERIDALDALVILTPQYNGSYPGALKNA